MSLAQVLAHPCLEPAQPLLLAGDPSRSRVRWVHSSDIYDIAPLLRGGELLLTTGLGLAPCTPDQRRAYVRSLAEREVAGLALELSTPFSAVPDDMVDEARRCGLPLVALRQVSPFVEVHEQINSAILDSSIVRLRHADEVGRSLSLVLADGGGLEALTARLAALVRRPVVLTDPSGAVLAAAADDPEAVVRAPAATAGVSADGVLLARLAIGDGTSADDLVRAATDRAPEILAIAVLRRRQGALLTGRELRHLLSRLLAGAAEASSALAAHAATSRLRADSHWAGLAVRASAAHVGLALVQDAAALPGVHVLAGELDGVAYGLLALPPGGAPEALDAVCAALAGSDALSAAGPLTDLAGAGRSLRAAQSCLELGPLALPGRRVLRAPDLVVERVLSAVREPLHLDDLVQEQLGGLLAVRGAETLLVTLEHYVASGCSKAATARELHLRRQSVHARLHRASACLGYDVGDPARQAGLRLALAARRATRAPVVSAPGLTAGGRSPS